VPGIRCLILRQTRESLTESALVTFERDVLSPNHPLVTRITRGSRQVYRYPNGSEIVVRGLRQGGSDQAARVMSAEYDLIYVQEAIEIVEESWEALTTRLRNGRLPYQQLLADTNPDRPTHWLKRRCDAGRTLMLESRHEDNPRLWSENTQSWTPEGQRYLARLDNLTGPRKTRLRYGRWVQAEGVVYEGWDPAVHIIDRFDIPADWPRLLSVDFGYTHPFVAQWWAVDSDSRLYLYREIYHTKRLVEDHARQIVELSVQEPAPCAVICDHDAEDRATLERHTGWATVPAMKDVAAGVQAVAARLKRQGDGKPRLFVLRDALVERDPERAEAKKPCCTAEEFDGYLIDTKKDRPVKVDDDGMDTLRYVVYSLDGPGQQAGSSEDYTVLRF